jgi:hypothetical protein
VLPLLDLERDFCEFSLGSDHRPDAHENGRDTDAQGLAKFNKAAFKKAGFSGTDYERIKQVASHERVSFVFSTFASPFDAGTA